MKFEEVIEYLGAFYKAVREAVDRTNITARTIRFPQQAPTCRSP
jgi:hypothetical protein